MGSSTRPATRAAPGSARRVDMRRRSRRRAGRSSISAGGRSPTSPIQNIRRFPSAPVPATRFPEVSAKLGRTAERGRGGSRQFDRSRRGNHNQERHAFAVAYDGRARPRAVARPVGRSRSGTCPRSGCPPFPGRRPSTLRPTRSRRHRDRSRRGACHLARRGRHRTVHLPTRGSRRHCAGVFRGAAGAEELRRRIHARGGPAARPSPVGHVASRPAPSLPADLA